MTKETNKMKRKTKKTSKKWNLDGFYFDGKDHFDLYKDQNGNVKRVKHKKKLKVC
jgi:hypothetical protein